MGEQVAPPPPDRDDVRDTRALLVAMLAVGGLGVLGLGLCLGLQVLMVLLGLPVK